MITWLIGENSFEVKEALREIKHAFSGAPEQKDATELSLRDLPELLMGLSLFAPERLVIITDITQNVQLWEKLPDWLPRINDAIHVVFIDTKPDKRTSSYKALKAVAKVQEFAAWGDRDIAKAEAWVMQRAASVSAKIDRPLAKHLVQRLGVDQWQLSKAVDTLELLDVVTKEAVDALIPAQSSENVFALLELALQGNAVRVGQMIRTLELQEEPYKLFALLSSQVTNLAAITFAEGDADPSKDFAIHPFVASKLSRDARTLGRLKVARCLDLVALADADMKRSKAEPWLLIEKTLYGIAAIIK